MTIDELLALLPEDKRGDAKKALETHGAVTPEKIKAYRETTEGSKILQSILDSEISKGVEAHDKKFMAEKLPDLVSQKAEELIKERHPELTKEQKEIAELKEQVAKTEKERVKTLQLARAQKALTEMKLPLDLADKYHGMSDAETDEAIKSLESVVKWRDDAVKAKDDEWLAKSGKPGGGDGANGSGNTMKRAEYEALPFDKKVELSKSGILLTD